MLKKAQHKELISTSTLENPLAWHKGKPSPKDEKVLLWCSFEVACVDWANDSRVWELSFSQPLQAEAPDGLSMVQECAGAVPAPADRTPLRSAAAARMKRIVWVDTQWQGLMQSSTSVTAFISYTTAIDSLARVTLVTLSFNLLQRAWPVEHISRGGREQTLDCLRSKWKLALSPAAVPWGNPMVHSKAPWSVVCFALHKVPKGVEDKTKAGTEKKGGNCIRELSRKKSHLI